MSVIKTMVFLQALALVFMVLLTASHKFDIASFKVAFLGFVVCLFILLTAAIICLVSLIVFSFYASHGAPWPLKLFGTVLGVLPAMTIILVIGKDGFSKPRIHDISTDPSIKLQFDVIPGLRKASDNALTFPSGDVIDQQKEAYPLIKPIIVQASAAEVYKQALAVSKDLNWHIVTSDKDQLKLEAIDETKFFGFKDDIVVVVTASEVGTADEYAIVNVRSVSRVGVSDLGANASRIHRFSQGLNAAF